MYRVRSVNTAAGSTGGARRRRADPGIAPPGRGGKGLRTGALGLAGGIVLGMSGTAPAYSLAASLGLVVVLVGAKTPAVLLIAFVPMYFIAVAFRELNKAEPDCGTSFTWVTRAFGPWAGWLAGWALMASCVIIMANLAQVAGAYTFVLVGLPDLAASTPATTVVGVGWIVGMTWLCHRGTAVSVRVQTAMLVVELLILAVLACLAFTIAAVRAPSDRALTPDLSWLSPTGVGATELVAAVLIAVFLYWGWDTALSINEESHDSRHAPGRAGVVSILLLVTTYLLVAVAVVAFAGSGGDVVGLINPDNAGDVFGVLGPAVFNDDPLGTVLQVVLVVSVLTSSAASTQTTILQTARAALAMGVHGALPARSTEIHPRYLTPSVATWATGTVAIVFYVGLTMVSENVLIDSIAAVALLISFYYGMTGFACVWYFRGELTGRALWTKGVLPGTGGLLLLVAFVMSAVGFATPDSSQTTVFGLGGALVIGLGSLALGAGLMVAYSRVAPAFFAGETLPVRVDQGRPVRFRLSLPFPRPARPQPAGPPPRPTAAQTDLFDPAGLTSPIGHVVPKQVGARDRPPGPGSRPAPNRPDQQRHRA